MWVLFIFTSKCLVRLRRNLGLLETKMLKAVPEAMSVKQRVREKMLVNIQNPTTALQSDQVFRVF